MGKIGIVLNNIGSPTSPSVRDVRKFLAEFLMDEDVISIPWFFRFLLVRGIIVPIRGVSSSEKYKKIWFEGREDNSFVMAYLKSVMAASNGEYPGDDALWQYMTLTYPR
jgi:ferrochelatase